MTKNVPEVSHIKGKYKNTIRALYLSKVFMWSAQMLVTSRIKTEITS